MENLSEEVYNGITGSTAKSQAVSHALIAEGMDFKFDNYRFYVSIANVLKAKEVLSEL